MTSLFRLLRYDPENVPIALVERTLRQVRLDGSVRQLAEFGTLVLLGEVMFQFVLMFGDTLEAISLQERSGFVRRSAVSETTGEVPKLRAPDSAGVG